MQLTHHTSPFKQKAFPIVIVTENVSNASNMGSLLRTADAFGIEKLVFCGENLQMERRFKKTSRSTEQYVDFSLKTDVITILQKYKSKGYSVIGLEITDKSVSLHNFKLKDYNSIVLLVGDENYGISEQALSFCDTIIHIDMYGHNTSMNVTHATSICLYELTNQLSRL